MKAVDITENPAGVDEKTMIFVREGDDIKSKVNQFKNKYNTKRRTL